MSSGFEWDDPEDLGDSIMNAVFWMFVVGMLSMVFLGVVAELFLGFERGNTFPKWVFPLICVAGIIGGIIEFILDRRWVMRRREERARRSR